MFREKNKSHNRRYAESGIWSRSLFINTIICLHNEHIMNYFFHFSPSIPNYNRLQPSLYKNSSMATVSNSFIRFSLQYFLIAYFVWTLKLYMLLYWEIFWCSKKIAVTNLNKKCLIIWLPNLPLQQFPWWKTTHGFDLKFIRILLEAYLLSVHTVSSRPTSKFSSYTRFLLIMFTWE